MAGVEAKKPSMDHRTFVKLGQDWVDRGQGACEVLGTIYLEETVSSIDTFHIAPYVDNTIRQEGKRTVTIILRGGKYHADINTEGTIMNRSIAPDQRAWAEMRRRSDDCRYVFGIDIG